MDSGPACLGRVASVAGAKVTGRLDPEVVAATSKGRNSGRGPMAEFGQLVKIVTRVSLVFGVISRQWTADSEASFEAAPRMMAIDLLGETVEHTDGRMVFCRGVSVYPRLGAEIFAVTPEDLAVVYARPGGACVRVGSVTGSGGLPAYVLVDGLLGKHFAVLGTTGCGKSCAVATILRSILNHHTAGHVVILDPHNEYAPAFGAAAEVINPTNLHLPYWLMNFDELVGALVSTQGADRQTEMTILKQAVLQARRDFLADEEEAAHATVDTPIPFRVGDVERIINNQMGRLNKAEGTLPYMRLLSRIETLRSDRRFEFMFSGLVVRDTMTDVLSRILRVPVEGKPVTVFDLSGVPSEIVDVVVSLLCRMVFDFAIWSAEAQAVPVLLVCEEAHRYVSQDGESNFALTRSAIARIAKEGRKYGVSLCLVSQRPSELSTTILSQCNTIFALRMSNEHDQEFVRRVLPDGATGLLTALPALFNGEAIAVGEGVSVPMRLGFEELSANSRPRSSTAVFSKAWKRDLIDRDFLDETIYRWRRQCREGLFADAEWEQI